MKQINISVSLLVIISVSTLSSGFLFGDDFRSSLFSESRASTEQCSALIASVKALTEAFPCVRDYCNPSSTVPTSAPSTPPTASTAAPPAPVSNAVQVGTYIPNWFVYKKHYMGYERLDVQDVDIDAELATDRYNFWAKDLEGLAPQLTHLYYAFWNLNAKCVINDSDPAASWYDGNPEWIKKKGHCQGLMNDMMALKSKFPHLKLLVSLGGWTYSRNFSKCASTAQGRENMYKSFSFLVNYMDKDWGKAGAIWNGADFDWEFPASNAGLYPDNWAADDWENYVTLINHFRTRAHGEGRTAVELTSAIGVGETLSILASRPNGTAKAFCDSLDHVNLMEYDIWGKWDRKTGHNAPFCHDTRSGNPSEGLSVVGTVKELAAVGCDMNKLHLGLPMYSHAWTGVPAGPHGNGLFTESSNEKWVGWSSFSDEDKKLTPQGIISWWDVKETVPKAGLTIYSYDCPADNGVVVPIKHVWGNAKGMFASYEDEETITAKTQWARNMGMGGFFFWDAQQDRLGDLLSVARLGYGDLPEHPATGTIKCYDDRIIDFNKDPLTGEDAPIICQLTNLSIPVTEGCGMTRQRAVAACGNDSASPVFLGGQRDGKCLPVCTPEWGAGPAMIWPTDIVHFACDESEIEESS